MNIIKQNPIQRYREPTDSYQWGKGRRKGQDWGRGLRGTNYNTMHTINKLQGYIVQNRKNRQYFIITLNGL